MAMTVKQIEEEVVKLSEEEQKELLARLIQISGNSKGDPEFEKLWTEEAIRRDEELEEKQEDGIPADKVFQELKQSE